jgi:hypothetical protein
MMKLVALKTAVACCMSAHQNFFTGTMQPSSNAQIQIVPKRNFTSAVPKKVDAIPTHAHQAIFIDISTTKRATYTAGISLARNATEIHAVSRSQHARHTRFLMGMLYDPWQSISIA